MGVGRGKNYQKVHGASATMRRCFLTSCCCLLLWSCLCALHVSCSPTQPDHFSLDPAQNMDNFLRQSLNNDSKYPFASPNGHIFLTQDPTDSVPADTSRYNVGRVSYKKPISLKEYHHQFFSFNTSFMFNITTATKYNESGDGIAFVMTTDAEIPQNSYGRFLGLMPESPHDRNESFLAVEFDTFQNLQAEIADPSASHIGIDISNLSSVAYLDTSDESHPLYLYHNYTFTAWVSYSASAELIQVWATNTSNPEHPPTDPVVTYRCNLAQVFEDHTDVYVGIIAASGNNSQAAILYTWSFMIVEVDTSPLNKWSIIIPSVSGAIGIFALAAAIYIAARRRQSANRLQMHAATIFKEAPSKATLSLSFRRL